MSGQRWLRNTVDGTIYGWNEILAKNPKCEEVTEEEAFPERFAPEHVKKPRRKKKKDVDVSTDPNIVAAVDKVIPETAPELAEEAARGWPSDA